MFDNFMKNYQPILNVI